MAVAAAQVARTVQEKLPEAIQEVRTFRGETTLVVKPQALLPVARLLKEDPDLGFRYLSDLSAVDYPERPQRFEVNYHLVNLQTDQQVRLKVSVGGETPTLPSVTSVWSGANWQEREVYDMFGIAFEGHPDLRRILMPHFWKGHPLRKDYPLGGEEVRFTQNKDTVVPQPPEWRKGLDNPEYADEEILDARAYQDETTMIINMGPQHPSTHGVLRLVLEVDGEKVVKAIPHIGYLHTGIEKTAENLTYLQAVTVTDRMDYLSPPTNNLAYALAVEKLMDVEVPLRAQYIRVVLAELTRLASHLVWLGTHAMEVGAMSVFFYCFRDREQILDIMDFVSGVRMMTSYIVPGGLRWDIPEGFHTKVRNFIDVFPAHLEEYHTLLTNNRIWEKRTQGIAVITAEEAIDLGLSGPNLRGSGVPWDLRKVRPYSAYDHFTFDVPTGTHGDVYDRYLVRMEEMRQSREIIRQALEKIEPRGPYRTEDRKMALPPREELRQSMEALIHHFLLVSRGFCPPVGEVYHSIESARGELGIYLVSDGSNKPYRMRVRAPSFVNLQALPRMTEGGLVADVIAAIGSLDPVMGEVDR